MKDEGCNLLLCSSGMRREMFLLSSLRREVEAFCRFFRCHDDRAFFPIGTHLANGGTAVALG